MKKFFEPFKMASFWISLAVVLLAYVLLYCIAAYWNAYFGILFDLWLILFVLVPVSWTAYIFERMIKSYRKNKQ